MCEHVCSLLSAQAWMLVAQCASLYARYSVWKHECSFLNVQAFLLIVQCASMYAIAHCSVCKHECSLLSVQARMLVAQCASTKACCSFCKHECSLLSVQASMLFPQYVSFYASSSVNMLCQNLFKFSQITYIHPASPSPKYDLPFQLNGWAILRAFSSFHSRLLVQSTKELKTFGKLFVCLKIFVLASKFEEMWSVDVASTSCASLPKSNLILELLLYFYRHPSCTWDLILFTHPPLHHSCCVAPFRNYDTPRPLNGTAYAPVLNSVAVPHLKICLPSRNTNWQKNSHIQHPKLSTVYCTLYTSYHADLHYSAVLYIYG